MNDQEKIQVLPGDVSVNNNDTAIILPAFNEELTIYSTIESFHTAMPSARIYVVNNNSCDKTAIIAMRAIQELNINGAILHEPRQGKGNALRRALLEVDADIYVMADADMTYPAEQIDELISPIIGGHADMVCGDRISDGSYFIVNTRTFHNFGNILIRTLINAFSNGKVSDIMTGYRAFNRIFAQSYPILAEGFQIETDMTIFALQNKFRIVEVPIRYINRPQGSFSKLNTVRDGLRVLHTIFNFLRHDKPFVFFSAVALCTGCLGLLAGLPVLLEFTECGFIRHIPLAVLASALEIAAITIFGVGLTLDSVAHLRDIDNERAIRAHYPPRYRRLDTSFRRRGGG
jgi:glycosyltransferase involved in cell wall biosynthesis